MPFKDKDQQRKYHREYQRKRRSEAVRVGLTDPRITLRLETLDDLRVVLEKITLEIINADSLDLGVKGRILAQLLTVGIRLVEGTDLEHRITALEERAEMSKYV